MWIRTYWSTLIARIAPGTQRPTPSWASLRKVAAHGQFRGLVSTNSSPLPQLGRGVSDQAAHAHIPAIVFHRLTELKEERNIFRLGAPNANQGSPHP